MWVVCSCDGLKWSMTRLDLAWLEERPLSVLYELPSLLFSTTILHAQNYSIVAITRASSTSCRRSPSMMHYVCHELFMIRCLTTAQCSIALEYAPHIYIVFSLGGSRTDAYSDSYITFCGSFSRLSLRRNIKNSYVSVFRVPTKYHTCLVLSLIHSAQSSVRN
jgi:hypothetical protein